MTSYCFVQDDDGKPLSPTKEKKAWYMVRVGKAELVSKYPMAIRLRRVIPKDEICKDEVVCGIDDGSKRVGIALVQKCRTYNKVLFKGTIEHRNDVKKLMDQRKSYRSKRRSNKRYRKARFNNRKSSKREDRVPPSILQKKQAVIRVVNSLNKLITINSYCIEDVAIDIRALTDGYKPYSWQYQKSNRLDENIRKAVIIRDGNKCMECGKDNSVLEAHHIRPRRLGGSDTASNLISLCSDCHDKTKGVEEAYMERYFDMLNTSDKGRSLSYASHVMIGKSWLRKQLSELGNLTLTTGGDTANRRIDWNIGKSHPNDAICITGLKPDTTDVKEWTIKPMRRQSKAKTDSVLNIRHRDLVEYTFRNGETHRGYVTALYPDLNAVNFQSPTKHCKKVNARKCKLLWKYNKIYWLEKTS